MANTIKRILVPVDFSAASRAALWRATELATALGATVDLLHVVDVPKPQHMAAEFYVPVPLEYLKDVKSQTEDHLRDWLATANVPSSVPREIAEGKPYVEIVKYARDRGIDLIVMGTHGRGGMSHLLLGSVADKVVRTVPCPVMTVRAEGASASPVPGLG
jgi:nucleotide-binding universal stress UspA family protein